MDGERNSERRSEHNSERESARAGAPPRSIAALEHALQMERDAAPADTWNGTFTFRRAKFGLYEEKEVLGILHYFSRG